MAESIRRVIPWLQFLRTISRQKSAPISFAKSREWRLVDGHLVHRTGGFFSVEGVRTTASLAVLDGCQQPVINQPEIGILGFLVAQDGDEWRWLLQAKGEPGNTLGVQLAPTVQATYSNYTRRHGGAPTFYIDHFTDVHAPLSDTLQSEQGTRFLRKFNRNVIVRVDHGLKAANDHFGWCSSSDVREVLSVDYAINTDARSVITTGPWHLLAERGNMFASEKAKDLFGDALAHSYDQAIRASIVPSVTDLLASIRRDINLEVHACRLDELDGWLVTEDRIISKSGERELIVEHFEVHAPDRERCHWDQPLFRSTKIDEVILLCQKRDGVLQFLLRPTLEPGLTGGAEIGPSFKRECARVAPEWLREVVSNVGDHSVAEVSQSDEGGRFMESRCRYRVVELPSDTVVAEDPWNLWVSLSELEALCRTPKLLTNEARSVVSVLLGLA